VTLLSWTAPRGVLNGVGSCWLPCGAADMTGLRGCGMGAEQQYRCVAAARLVAASPADPSCCWPRVAAAPTTARGPPVLLLLPANPAGAVGRGAAVIARVVRTRYFMPSTMPTDLPDPVVTSNGDRLRFESFSWCWRLRPLRRPVRRAGRRRACPWQNDDVNPPTQAGAGWV
jgi:hypothetical protein